MEPSTTLAVPVTHGSSRRLPGEAGVWLLIFGDMLVFSLFFLTIAWCRSQNLALFRASQEQLNQALGMLNTLLMLSSSWFVATGVHAARKNLGKVTAGCFLVGFLCGLGFVVVKYFEYGAKIRAGITINTNDFFMYYYMFTGIHLLHVLIGMGVLALMARYSWSGRFDAGKVSHLESGASFWHLVDLLWIVLFALLYLMR